MRHPETLALLCNAAGVGGEREAQQVAAQLLRTYTDDVRIDPLGNVIARIPGQDPKAPTVLLEAHIDEIGFVVTEIDDDGFLHVDKCGGIDTRVLTGTEVVVYGKQPLPGVFGAKPPHLAGSQADKPAQLADMSIDIGLPADQARAAVPVGSRVTFRPNFTALVGSRVTSKALDDRAGCAAVLEALASLKESPAKATVLVAFSVMEELGGYGASAAGFALTPDVALITDVGFGLTPDCRPSECGELGKGAMLGISPILDMTVIDRLEQLAKQYEIPFQYDVMGGRTGTDADDLAVSRAGISTGLLSIPQKFMHTPCEMVDTRDVSAVGEWMAAFVREGV